MDYDYYDETRTRFQVQSGQRSTEPEQEDQKKLNIIEVGACISISVLILCFAWKKDGWAQFALLWIALSMLAGPFAPLSCTGGDCRVGVGETLTPEVKEQPLEEENRSNAKNNRKSAKGRENINQSRSEHDRKQNGSRNDVVMATEDNSEILDADNDENAEASLVDDVDNSDNVKFGSDVVALKQGFEEKWTTEDIDLLKKLMVKHPRGKLRRWEVIAEGFKGRHSVDSIVKISKDLSERSNVEANSYSQFLAKRKTSSKDIDSPLTQRWDVDEENNMLGDDNQSAIPGPEMLSATENDKKKKEWTETEDKALLNALKTFPKDTPMRWEKVAIAVPGRTKPQCFRRYSELRDSFRNKQLEKDSKSA